MVQYTQLIVNKKIIMKYLFEWTPAISVFDNKIDAQHQRLLGQINTLLSYILSEKNDEIIVEAVSFLDRYVNEHFTYEEKYMVDHEYPDIENHIKWHKDFAKHYEIFKKELSAGASRETLALDIEHYIGNWWLTHITVEDHKYAEFIKAHEKKV